MPEEKTPNGKNGKSAGLVERLKAGVTFYLFIVLTLTGVLLMFYDHPSKVHAFRDVLYLEHDVPFGKLLRNMHRWAAHLMVIAVELHMFRVFLTGSYKKPREFNWN